MEQVNEIYVGGIPLFGPNYVVTPNGYTPKAAVANVLYSGNLPVAQSYDNVEEPFEIFVKGATADACVANKRALDLALRTARYTAPCVISLKAKGQTNTGYAEIYSANTQEGPEFIGKEAGAFMMRVSGTWVRSAFWGASALDATGVATTTFTNNGSGNLTALGALSGDLIYEGSPLNLKVDGPAAATTNVDTLWLATAKSRVKTTHTTAVGATTTSTSAHSTTGIDATPLLANKGVDLAIFVRFSSLTNGHKAQFAIQITSDDGKNITPITAWQSLPVLSIGTTNMLYAGTFSLDGQRVPIATALPIELRFHLKSIDGTSVACTVDYTEAVFAYAVAEITQDITSGLTYGSGGNLLYLTTAQNLNGSAWLPLIPPRVYVALSAGVNPTYTLSQRGRAPTGISGASLWAAWTSTNGAHVTTDTLRLTATHAPLYRTLRGGS